MTDGVKEVNGTEGTIQEGKVWQQFQDQPGLSLPQELDQLDLGSGTDVATVRQTITVTISR